MRVVAKRAKRVSPGKRMGHRWGVAAMPLQLHRPRVPPFHLKYDTRRAPRHPHAAPSDTTDGATEAWFGINFYEVLKVRLNCTPTYASGRPFVGRYPPGVWTTATATGPSRAKG